MLLLVSLDGRVKCVPRESLYGCCLSCDPVFSSPRGLETITNPLFSAAEFITLFVRQVIIDSPAFAAQILDLSVCAYFKCFGRAFEKFGIYPHEPDKPPL
jgi:hypothetical protein